MPYKIYKEVQQWKYFMLNFHVAEHYVGSLYIHVTVRRYGFLFNNQPDALIIKII
jgi:hypothetical protein